MIDLSAIDPKLIERIVAGVSWGAGALVAAGAYRLAGLDVPDLFRALF